MENNNQPLIKVVIKKRVTQMIEYFCQQMRKIEWSGTVFYTCEGSIRDPNNFTIVVKDMYLQGIGTAGYTESDMDLDLFRYMEKRRLDNCVRGIIHSHNSMSAYFSGTDKKELVENCVHNNIYLSIVVNNKLESVATVFQRKYMVQSYSFDEKGEKYDVPVIQNNLIDYTSYDCKVEFEGRTPSPFPEFEAMIDSIVTKTAKAGTVDDKLDKARKIHGKSHGIVPSQSYQTMQRELFPEYREQEDDFTSMNAFY
jgi:proteasome lid subunit RPN8/RPN11